MSRVGVVCLALSLVFSASLVHSRNGSNCLQDGPADCDFTHNVCDWVNDNTVWINKMILENAVMEHLPEQKTARLASQWACSTNGNDHCFKLRYRFTKNGVIELMIKIKTKTEGTTTPWEKTSSSDGWDVAKVPVVTNSDFKVIILSTRLEDRTGGQIADRVYIDDIQYETSPCSSPPNGGTDPETSDGNTALVVGIVMTVIAILVLVVVALVFVARRRQLTFWALCCGDKKEETKRPPVVSSRAAGSSLNTNNPAGVGATYSDLHNRDSSASTHVYSAIDDAQHPSLANGALRSSGYSVAKLPADTGLTKPNASAANAPDDDPYEIKDMDSAVKQEFSEDDYNRLNIDQRAGGNVLKPKSCASDYNHMAPQYSLASPETATGVYHYLEKEDDQGAQQGVKLNPAMYLNRKGIPHKAEAKDPNSAPIYHVLEDSPTTAVYHVPKSSIGSENQQATPSSVYHVLEDNNPALASRYVSPKGQPKITPQPAENDKHGHSAAPAGGDSEDYNCLSLNSGKRPQGGVKGHDGATNRGDGEGPEGVGAYSRLGNWAGDAYCLVDRDNKRTEVIDGEYSHIK